MKEWRFFIERTEMGEVTVTANTEEEARAKARDYGKRVIQVNNKSWANQQFLREDLIEVTDNEKSAREEQLTEALDQVFKFGL